MRRLKHVLIAGLLFLPWLVFSAQAPMSPFGALQTTPDKSMVVFPIANQTNQITLTPAGEAYQTGTTFPESVVVSAWKEIGTLARTIAPLAAILTKYNVHITAADGTPIFPEAAPMAVTLVAEVVGATPDGNAFTTTSINTSGANFLIAAVGSYDPLGAPTLSDTKSNTWTPLTSQSGDAASIQLYYSKNPTVGSGHGFTLTPPIPGSSLISIAVQAFSGVDTTSPFDQQNTAGSGVGVSTTTAQPGSITPSGSNYLVVTGVMINQFQGSNISINSSFETMVQNTNWIDRNTNQSLGTGISYLVQGGAAAVNPTWTFPTSSQWAAAIASFKVAAGATGSLFRAPLLNGLGAGGPFFNNPLGRHYQPDKPQSWMKVNGIYRKAA